MTHDPSTTGVPVTGATVAPAKLAHVVLRSRSYDEALDWWSTLLNAEIGFRSPFISFMSYDDEHHRLAIMNAGETAADPSPGVGMDHVAFTFASLGDLLETYIRLRDQGIVPFWTINHGPTTSFYYRDPDGLAAELQIDNFETADALAEWFSRGAFAENPIGVDFDPEVLVERFQAGVPVSELVEQGSAPAAP